MKQKIICGGVVPIEAFIVVDTELTKEQLMEKLSAYKVQCKLAGRFEVVWDEADTDFSIEECDEEEEEADFLDKDLAELFVKPEVTAIPVPLSPEELDRLARRKRAADFLRGLRKRDDT